MSTTDPVRPTDDGKSNTRGAAVAAGKLSTPAQRRNFFLRIPLVVYEALLVTVLLVAAGVAYMLVSRFGFGEIFALAPVEFMEADTHHSVLQSIAELPVPPGMPHMHHG